MSHPRYDGKELRGAFGALSTAFRDPVRIQRQQTVLLFGRFFFMLVRLI
jgi:hypothetical protein